MADKGNQPETQVPLSCGRINKMGAAPMPGTCWDSNDGITPRLTLPCICQMGGVPFQLTPQAGSLSSHHKKQPLTLITKTFKGTGQFCWTQDLQVRNPIRDVNLHVIRYLSGHFSEFVWAQRMLQTNIHDSVINFDYFWEFLTDLYGVLREIIFITYLTLFH